MKKINTKSPIFKIIINLVELAVLVLLIFIIVYLVRSDNGILGIIGRKDAAEKLEAAIQKYTSEQGAREIEEYLGEIDGVGEIKPNQEDGTILVTIDVKQFVVIRQATQTGIYGYADNIYFEEVTPESENSSENEEESSNEENSEQNIEQQNTENMENEGTNEGEENVSNEEGANSNE